MINEIFFGICANSGKMKKVNMIPEGFAVGDGNPFWSQGVLDNVRTTDVILDFKEGINDIDIFALDPDLVLLKLVITKEGEKILPSYLGPCKTFRS